MSNLKPCPFCGGAPKVIERPSDTDDGFVCVITCISCSGQSTNALGEGASLEGARMQARLRWNTRTEKEPAPFADGTSSKK